jgi:hypothetical protein
MKSIERAQIVVVAGGERGEALAAQLRRMHVRQVTTVSDIDEARRLCAQGEASLCLVIYADAGLDAAPPVVCIAPGRESGTPSLMVIDVVTPYSRRIARRAGYRAAVPVKIEPRMLYRRIGAALQGRSGRLRPRPSLPLGIAGQMAPEFVEFRGPTLH